MSQVVTTPVTIQGVMIDVPTYVESGQKAGIGDRKTIPVMSLKAGDPIGILEKGTGRIYLVTMDQKDTSAVVALEQFLGVNVRAKGRIYKRGGVQLFVLSDIVKSGG
jgi:hypothetical protein